MRARQQGRLDTAKASATVVLGVFFPTLGARVALLHEADAKLADTLRPIDARAAAVMRVAKAALADVPSAK